MAGKNLKWLVASVLLASGCAALTFPIYTPNREWYDYPWYEYYYWYYDYWDYDYEDDEDCHDLDTLINEIDYDCNSTGWWYSVLTDGWTNQGALDMQQTAVDPEVAWSESHDLYSDDYDPMGCWDLLVLELGIEDYWENQQTNVSTLYDCTTDRADTLTWMIRVWDTDDIMSDCAVWGHDPSYYEEYGCLTWNQ